MMLGGIDNRALAFGALALALMAVLGYAISTDRHRESGPSTSVSAAASQSPFLPGVAMRPALTAEEETYIAALWKVHEIVKTNAARMSFAGLYYKTGDIDRSEVKNRVAPLTPLYQKASEQARRIGVPDSMRSTHEQYLAALALYEQASIEMTRVADDGKDEHLLSAQAKSEKASTVLLKVGEQLWPGEYKPN
jgi:hypothetical protein